MITVGRPRRYKHAFDNRTQIKHYVHVQSLGRIARSGGTAGGARDRGT